MRKIRYAIIGFGGIAQNRIATEGFGLDRSRFTGHPQAELVAATSISPSRKPAVEQLGIQWADSLEDILNDPAIEAVCITTNNLSHAPIAEKALRAKKHCFIEKPMATTLNDAIMLQQLARQNRLSLSVDHMMTYNVYNQRAKALVQRGELGTVTDISLHMEFLYGSTPEEAGSWRCSNPQELGGPIGDVASHCVYMAEFLLESDIVSLSCAYTPKTLDIAVENGANIQFTLENGIQGSVTVAFNRPRGGLESTLTNLGYEIYGDRGILRSYGTLFQLSGHDDEPIPQRVEVDRFHSTESITVHEVKNIYQEVIAQHANSILNQTPFDGSDAIHNLERVLAAHESATHDSTTITFK